MKQSSDSPKFRIPPEVEDAATGLSVIIIETRVGDFGAYVRQDGALLNLALGSSPVTALMRALKGRP